MVVNVLILAISGAMGTLARAGLHHVTHQHWVRSETSLFPWGTLLVNALGCLLFGIVFGYTESRTHLPPQIKLAVLTGFMGAFTTFSTFAHDSAHLARGGAMALALANVLISVLLGLSLAWLGYFLVTR